MARIDLFLLGLPRLGRDGVPLQCDTRKILARAAYVAVSGLGAEGARLSRDRFLALLWPDLEPSRARAVLRRNLSQLKKALEAEWLVVDRQMVSTDPKADFDLDVEQFNRLVRAWETHDHSQEQVCPECLEALTEAVALYQGGFLEGFGLRDSVAYDDWQFFQAEDLRQELASALERLVLGHSSQGNHKAALPYARRRLGLDPLHKPAHRQLMQLYAQTGQRSAALRQYTECGPFLDEELGLAPTEETTTLYEQIRSMSTSDAAVALALAEPIELPSRTASPRHNLPAQTTPFVGRERELAEIGNRLQDPDCRLLTLLGPGGIGKTRLALRGAEDLVESQPTPFEHGVFLVSLAQFRTAEGVVPAVAEAPGYSFHTDPAGSTGTTPRQQLLLVMDNYEHLLVDRIPGSHKDGSDGTGFVTDLRDVPPRQRSIRAAFEHSWRLLEERGREVFLGLSVFQGGFTREAALEVVGASLRDPTPLSDKSLLRPFSPGRYELHELLRQYGAEHLGLVPEQGEAVRDRHCAYYSSALERWARELKGARQREALEEMDLEIDSVSLSVEITAFAEHH